MLHSIKHIILGREVARWIEDAGLPHWVVDRQSLRFLHANKAAIDMYGYSLREFRSLSLRQVRPCDHVKEFEKAYANPAPALRYKGVWTHRRKDKSLLLARVWSVDILYGKRQSRLTLLEDVTPLLMTDSWSPN